jgi:hypothetical protein
MSVGYWYVSFADAATKFFRDEEPLSEDQWRAGAPADQIAKLDAEQKPSGAPLFPKDIAAS